MDRNHAAFHRLRRMIIDQNHRLPHDHDLFQLKQSPMAIYGLRGCARREAFAVVGFPVDRKRDGQSHPQSAAAFFDTKMKQGHFYATSKLVESLHRGYRASIIPKILACSDVSAA